MITPAPPSPPTDRLKDTLGEMRAAIGAERPRKGLAGALQAAMLGLLELLVALLADFRAGRLALVVEGSEGSGIRCIRQNRTEPYHDRDRPPASRQATATRWIPPCAGLTGTPSAASATEQPADARADPLAGVTVVDTEAPPVRLVRFAVRSRAKRARNVRARGFVAVRRRRCGLRARSAGSIFKKCGLRREGWYESTVPV
jgi:hypothetical protein